ncbi:MAG: O-antigen ligase family protein [Nitrospinota bacterium]|nr:O-antigen ligase family protein [Nitrospinota bacterium]MDH5677912.1 O-antigen ligase family protein [Nitrospinota bacterium]
MNILTGIKVGENVYTSANGVNGHNGRSVNAPAPVVKADVWTRAAWAFLYLFAFTNMFSISVAQIFAGLATVAWVGKWRADGKAPSFSPLAIPLLLFMILSLLAATFSVDRFESLKDSKDLFHFAIFLVAFDFARKEIGKITSIIRILVAGGAVIAIVGIYQAIQRGVTTADRINGFNDMYMTYAGLLMLAFVGGMALVSFDFKGWKDSWLIPALGVIVCAVLLSLTRNAWIGMAAGAFVVLAMRKPVSVAIIPILAALALALAPAGVKDRFTSIFNPNDSANQERIYIWTAGVKMLTDYPALGIGQNSFPKVYPEYRNPNVKEPFISHLHNNILQIAVERGMPCLLAWLAIWGVAYYSMGMAFRKESVRKGARATGLAVGLGGITAFLSAGMFEYNFGDAEPQMLALLLLAIGMAAAQYAPSIQIKGEVRPKIRS